MLLAEAGTGTGKTLAYLVPAILSRQRVLISTGTKNLQEQIFFKDLPVLRDALGMPVHRRLHEGPRQLSLPASLRGAQGQRRDPVARRRRSRSRRIDEWARETETGDRAEIDDLPDDLPLWTEIAATSENCLGRECPRFTDCFVTRMRQRAAEADLVIVNHHLLCADAAVRQSAFGEVIPACRYAVIDEAHQLEDVATQYFGIAVSNYRVDDSPATSTARSAAQADRRSRTRRTTLRDDVDSVRDGARLFFGTLQMLAVRGAGAGGREPHCASTAPDCSSAPRADAAGARSRALEAVEATIALRQGPARGRDRPRAPRRRADAATCSSCTRADDPGYVYYLEIRGRGVFLRASPIDVSDDRPRDAARPDDGDGADLGDADASTAVRLHPRAASGSARRTKRGCRRSSTTRSRRSSTCRRRCPTRARRSSSARRRARSSRS